MHVTFFRKMFLLCFIKYIYNFHTIKQECFTSRMEFVTDSVQDRTRKHKQGILTSSTTPYRHETARCQPDLQTPRSSIMLLPSPTLPMSALL